MVMLTGVGSAFIDQPLYGLPTAKTDEFLANGLGAKYTASLENLIGSWGVRRYYQKRKGETLLSPAEQQQVVALARKLGVRLDEYFDGYVEEYD